MAIALFFSCNGQEKNRENFNFEIDDSDETYIMSNWSNGKIDEYYKRIGILIADLFEDYKVPDKTSFTNIIKNTLNVDVNYNKSHQIAPVKIIDDYKIDIIIFPKSKIVAFSNELPLLDSISVKHYKSSDYQNIDHSEDNNLILNKVFFEGYSNFKAKKIINLLKKNNITVEGNPYFSNTAITENKPKALNDFIYKNYFILDSISGKINNDDYLDKILVLADQEEYDNNNPRILLVLLQDKNGKYILDAKNEKFIPCYSCAGGVGGEESYSSLILNEKNLSFKSLEIQEPFIIEKKFQFINSNSTFILKKVLVITSNLYNDESTAKKETLTFNNVTLKHFNFNDSKYKLQNNEPH